MSELPALINFRGWSTRNPLGVIALFLSLVYGLGAGFVGFSVEKLSPTNQTIFVWFLVLFPCAILAAFCWLVVWHHRKLYGPGDFRSDEGFLTATAPPQAFGERLNAEVGVGSAKLPTTEPDQLAPESEWRGESAESNHRLDAKHPLTKSKQAQAHSETVSEAFLLEGLAFQELQREFDAPIRREVIVYGSSGKNSVVVDGIIEPPGATPIIVELKLLRGSEVRRRIRELKDAVQRLITVPSKIIVVLIHYDLPMQELDMPISDLRRALPRDADVRIFSVSHLRNKYGFAAEGRETLILSQ